MNLKDAETQTDKWKVGLYREEVQGQVTRITRNRYVGGEYTPKGAAEGEMGHDDPVVKRGMGSCVWGPHSLSSCTQISTAVIEV